MAVFIIMSSKTPAPQGRVHFWKFTPSQLSRAQTSLSEAPIVCSRTRCQRPNSGKPGLLPRSAQLEVIQSPNLCSCFCQYTRPVQTQRYRSSPAEPKLRLWKHLLPPFLKWCAHLTIIRTTEPSPKLGITNISSKSHSKISCIQCRAPGIHLKTCLR